VVLVLLLTIISIGSASAADDELLLNVRLGAGECVQWDATCYNDAADAAINEELIFAEICEGDLRECGDGRIKDKVVWGGGGFLLGFIAAVLAGR